MIQASLRIVAPPEKRDDILRAFRSLLGPTRVAPGCLRCHVCVDMEDENAIIYVEEWQATEDLERRLRSDQYRRVLAMIETSTEAPELRYNTISETTGLEYLAAVRGVHDKVTVQVK